MNLDTAPRERSFKQILRWAPWTLLGAVVLWCWMVLGVAALAFFNYLVLFLDPPQPEDTPVWIAYLELAGLTCAWPLVLMFLTLRVRMLHRVLLCWFAVIGLLSVAFGGWNVAGRHFDRPSDRIVSGVFILSAAALGWLAARTRKNSL